VASRLPGHETDERRVDGFVDAAWEAVTTNGYDPERVETLLDEYGLADRSASLAGEVKERARRWAERSYEARADREGAYAVVHEPDEGPVRVLTTPGAAGVRFGDKHVEHDVDVAAPIDDLRVEDVHETDAEADLVFTNNVFDYADPGAVVERVAADDGAHVEYLGRDRADEAVRSADAGTRLVDGDVKASGYHKGRHRVVAVDPDGAERDRWLVPGETAAGEDETPDHGAGRSA
jgi:hypothetical protein